MRRRGRHATVGDDEEQDGTRVDRGVEGTIEPGLSERES